MSWQASNTLREFAWGRHSLVFDLDIFAFFRIPDCFCQISSFSWVSCVVEQSWAEQTECENRNEGRWHASLFLFFPCVSFLSTIVSHGYLLYDARVFGACIICTLCCVVYYNVRLSWQNFRQLRWRACKISFDIKNIQAGGKHTRGVVTATADSRW